MLKTFALVLSGALALLWLHAAISEETTSGLHVATFAELRVDGDGLGSSKFIPVARLRVGDEIFYTLQVRNFTAAEIPTAVIVKSVPQNTSYVAESAVGPAAIITFSTDGGATFVAKRVLDSPTDAYTHIRWELRHPLAPGATALLRFRTLFK